MDSEAIAALIIISGIIFIIAFAFISSKIAEYNELNQKYQRLSEQTKDFNAKSVQLDNEIRAYQTKQAECDKIIIETEKTKQEYLQYRQQAVAFKDKYSRLIADHDKKTLENIAKTIARAIITPSDLDSLYEGIENGRLINSLEDNLSIKKLDITAVIPSATQPGEVYTTTITNCGCKDRKNNHFPCKHSLFLAYSLGVLQMYPTYIEDKYIHTLDEYNVKLKEKLTLEEKIKKAQKRHQNLIRSNNLLDKSQNEINQIIERLITDKCSGYPYLAGIIADLKTMHYQETAEYLENKQHPAKSEAKRIKELRAETRVILSERNELKYKLDYLKKLYPNIEDVFDDGYNQDFNFTLETDDNTDRVRNFLSHEEYNALSVTDRNQLALDRYVENHKSKWQIGRDYEMYVGHTLEQQGCTVEYTGILENLEDMGRDLIVRKGDIVQIVQCKNWSQEKTIHEKHIFQLYGSVILYRIEHPELCVEGVFLTTTTVSDKAKTIALHLGIVVEEEVPLGDFPRIKCNINRQTGEKIYHLPFDQQYDKTVIEKEHGEFMAFTVKEAENAGFRRAFKHFT